MKTLHHVFEICVLTFLAWEATAKKNMETIKFENQVSVVPTNSETRRTRERMIKFKPMKFENQVSAAYTVSETKKVSEWNIEVDTVKSIYDFENRHFLYEGNQLVIFYVNNKIDARELDVQMYKVDAAREFARFHVKNGLYLIVPKNIITEDFRVRYNIQFKNYLWFDLKDKSTYENRYENYPDRRIYTLFHNYQPDCKTTKEYGCLEAIKAHFFDNLKNEYDSSYDRVVLLTVHVDVVHEDFIKNLCPKLGAPLEYPALYHEGYWGLYVILGKFRGEYEKKSIRYWASESC
ncbi:uncharacterized protein LOC128988985 isoform X2 [Macrosteles quadrilineatus]|uniref:uncharacterized protein LOC128988985 isoform X2 n=1 Tax=Macrosteles quadrilineatus TaxID=74068 RepID=UPI0023E17852|nr:uncharacterized protein LOC128988985 isoform X2 [Macrosteles quadrilineatus]